MKKGDGRSIPRDALEHYRFQAIELRKKGWKVNKIAEAFGLNHGSVSHWFTKAGRNGRDSLRSKKAKGKEPKINPKERMQIIEWAKEDAREFGFSNPLWTCKQIKILIKKKFDKNLSISNVWELLRKANLTPKKPKREAFEKDKKAVKKWIKEEWLQIKEIVLRQQAMLYFQDEAGVSLIPYLRTTWSPKGETPTIKVTGKKGGVCVSSAISPAGRMIFRIEKGRMTSETYIDFLAKIILQHPHRKIVVISDNAPIHTSKSVQSFALSNKKRISLFYIPSYSPELNPDEHVWSYLKTYELAAHQAHNKKELRKIVDTEMRKIAKKENLIQSFFMKKYMH